MEVYSPLEVIDFIKEMHLSIVDKPHRKELSMYSRRGFKPSNKAKVAGFNKELELTYISWLMCIPGVSENKAIAVARAYPTFDLFMTMIKDESRTEKQKKILIMEISVQGIAGEKGKRLGKAVADKLFMTFMSTDPNIIIS